MKDAEHKHILDDLDVEITDLPAEEIERLDDGRYDGISKNTYEGIRIDRPYDTRSLLQSRLSPRQRALQLTGTISMVVFAVLVIFGSTASVRDMVAPYLLAPTPTASPTSVPTSNLFYIQGIPSWATVVIDGHTISHLPRIGDDAPLHLARGKHLIAWKAYPFQAQSCFLTVPINFTAPNPCFSPTTVTVSSETWAWVLGFSVTLNMLPKDQRMALVGAAQRALDALQSTDTVQPGERYARALSPSRVATATQPLRATLRFELDTSNDANKPCSTIVEKQPCMYEGQSCRQFCNPPGLTPSSPSLQNWNVLAVIRPSWTYITADGKVVAQNQPDTSGNDAASEYLTDLDIVWHSGGWRVIIPTAHEILLSVVSPACASAQSDIETNGYYGTVNEGNFSEVITWMFFSGSNSAAGCLAIGTPRSDASIHPNAPRLPAAYILHRFGMLLTANDVARRYFPSILPANAYERHLAQQLATTQFSQ